MNQLIASAAATAHYPDEYDRRYHQLEARHSELEAQYQHIAERIDDLRRRAQAVEVRDFLATQPPLEYSD